MVDKRQGGSIYGTSLLHPELCMRSGLSGTLRLRYVLAEDGCKESQVSLAKSLLNAPSSNAEERSNNAQLAVYWLLQAAQKGQEESFTLLKECVDNGIGVNTLNFYQIEKCLKFSSEEKISRRVSYFIFRAIMSDTEDLVPENILQEKVELILKEDTKEKLWAKINEDLPSDPQPVVQKDEVTNLSNPSVVSFSEVLNSVHSCLEGNVPLVSLKQVSHYADYRWCTKYIAIMWNIVLRSAEKLFKQLSTLVFPITLLFLCLLLQFISLLLPSDIAMSNFLTKSVLITITYYCFVIMLSTTCFVIWINFGGDNVIKWLNLIKIFEPNVRSKDIEQKYLSKTTLPLVTFLVISFLYCVLVPLHAPFVPSTDVSILSFILMFFVDRTISYRRYIVQTSFIINALICVYKYNIFQDFSQNILSFFDWSVNLEVFENTFLHLSIISCLALPFVLPYLYLKMALSKPRGWHLILLPHLMSVVWMNLACQNLSNITTVSFLFSLFYWFLILFLIKYVGIIFTFILYMFVKLSFGVLKVEYMFLSFIFIILYFLSLVVVKKGKVSYEKQFWPSFLCLTAVILTFCVITPEYQHSDVTNNEILPWEKYQTYCHHAWYRTNTAEAQIACFPLKGRELSIEGTVSSIDVVHVSNKMQMISHFLPGTLNNWFSCTFGINYFDCDSNALTASEKERCTLYNSLGQKACSLHNWDEYKYQLAVEVSSRTSPEIVLIADHICSNFIKNLKEGDSLQMIGILESNIGKLKPHFILKKAQCTSCYCDISSCNTSSVISPLDYQAALKNMILFYFGPFILYK